MKRREFTHNREIPVSFTEEFRWWKSRFLRYPILQGFTSLPTPARDLSGLCNRDCLVLCCGGDWWLEMDANFLFRLKPSKASPAPQTNAKTGEAGKFRPNPASLTKSQERDEVPSSGSVIRHSFDQIYRATPLHPLLASQLRTTTQQVATPSRILPLRQRTSVSRLSDPAPALTPPAQRMASNGLFSTTDFVESNNHSQSLPRQTFSPPIQTSWTSPPQLYQAPSVRAPGRTQEYFNEANYFTETESNDNYSNYPQNQPHPHHPHSFSAPSVSVPTPMSSSLAFAVPQLPSRPLTNSFNASLSTNDNINSNVQTTLHNADQSMRNHAETAPPITGARGRSSRGAQQNSMDSLLALARNNHAHSVGAMSSSSNPNAPHTSSFTSKSTAVSSAAPRASAHKRSDSSPYFSSKDAEEKVADQDSDAEREEASEATFEEIGYLSAEAEDEGGVRHRDSTADLRPLATTTLHSDNDPHHFNQKRKRSQQQAASSFLLQPHGNAAATSSAKGSQRTVADKNTVDAKAAQVTRSGRVSKSGVAPSDRNHSTVDASVAESTSRVSNSASKSSSSTPDGHSVPEKTKSARTARARVRVDALVDAAHSPATDANAKTQSRKRKGRFAVSSDSDERSSVDSLASSSSSEAEDEAADEDEEDGGAVEQQSGRNLSRSRAKKRARRDTEREGDEEDGEHERSAKEVVTKKETKTAKTKASSKKTSKPKTAVAPPSSSAPDAGPLTVAQRLRLLAASMHTAGDRETQMKGVLGRTTVTTAPADPRSNDTATSRPKQNNNSQNNNNQNSNSMHADTSSSDAAVDDKSSSFRPWTPSEVVALYAVHAKTDITRVDFWEALATTLQRDKGVQRSARDCQTKWFAALHETQRRRVRLQQRKQESQVQEALKKMQSMNEATASILTQRMRPVQSSAAIAGKSGASDDNHDGAKQGGAKSRRSAAADSAAADPSAANKRKGDRKRKGEEGVEEQDEERDKEKGAEEAEEEEGAGVRPSKKSKQSRLGKNDLKVGIVCG